MPELNGADSLTFFGIPGGLADQVVAWREGLAALAQSDGIDAWEVYKKAQEFLQLVSLRQITHGLTIFPRGVAPGYEYYAQKYQLRSTPGGGCTGDELELEEFDPSGVQDVLYAGLVELSEFPLLGVNLFAAGEREALVIEYEGLLRMEMEEREAAGIAKALRFVRRTRPDALIALLYAQWD